MKRKTILTIMLLAAALGAVTLWWQNQRMSALKVGAHAAPASESVATEPEQGLALSDSPLESGSLSELQADPQRTGKPDPARDISHATGPEPDELESDAWSPYEMPASQESAMRWAAKVNECRGGAFSAERVQKEIDSRSAQAGWNENIVWMIRGKVWRFDNLADYEAWLWSRQEECAEIHQRETGGLRSALLDAALEGDVYARYLYAMWPPVEDYANAAVLLEYSEHAMEFSWRNIEEGEPLGMLALAQSYWFSGSTAMFTQRSVVLGRMFLLAAVRCGIGSRWIESEVGLKPNQYAPSASDPSSVVTELNLAADSLRRQYCD